MSAINPLLSPSSLETIQRLLTCPVSGKLMRYAVSFVPCGHTVSEAPALEIIRARDELRKCPVCSHPVQVFIPNPDFQSLIQQIFKDCAFAQIPQIREHSFLVEPSSTPISVTKQKLTSRTKFCMAAETVTAQSFFPCGHTLSENAMRNFLAGRWPDDRCPTCKCRADNSIPNPSLQQFAKEIQKIHRTFEIVIPQIRDFFKQHSVQVIPQVIQPVNPYPGKLAKFVFIEEHPWQIGYRRDHKLFRSVIEDSLIEQFSFFCSEDGSVAISILFRKKSDSLSNYLRSLNINETEPALVCGRTKERCRVLFKMVTDNNEFPENFFQNMKKIFELSEGGNFFKKITGMGQFPGCVSY